MPSSKDSKDLASCPCAKAVLEENSADKAISNAAHPLNIPACSKNSLRSPKGIVLILLLSILKYLNVTHLLFERPSDPDTPAEAILFKPFPLGIKRILYTLADIFTSLKLNDFNYTLYSALTPLDSSALENALLLSGNTLLQENLLLFDPLYALPLSGSASLAVKLCLALAIHEYHIQQGLRSGFLLYEWLPSLNVTWYGYMCAFEQFYPLVHAVTTVVGAFLVHCEPRLFFILKSRASFRNHLLITRESPLLTAHYALYLIWEVLYSGLGGAVNSNFVWWASLSVAAAYAAALKIGRCERMRTAVQRRRLLVCPCCPGKYKALVEPMSDITTHYGGSIMAMAGKGCVAIIADHRLGNGFIMVSKRFRRVFPLTPRTYVGFGGFTPDAQHLLDKLKTRVQLFRLDEGRDIEPDELANLISYMLYAHRASPLYVSPIVAGLRADGTPYVCGMDCLGSKTEPGTFVVGGTAEHNLAGMCEALYAENMDADRLFTATGQAFLNAVGRDALSGWGAECIVITPERRIERELKGRCD